MYNEIIAALEEAATDQSAITVFTGKTKKLFIYDITASR